MHRLLSSSYMAIASRSLWACTHDTPFFYQAFGDLSDSATEGLGSSVASWEVCLGACVSQRWLWPSSLAFCLSLSVAAGGHHVYFNRVVLLAVSSKLLSLCQLLCSILTNVLPLGCSRSQGLTYNGGLMLLLLALPMPPQPLSNLRTGSPRWFSPCPGVSSASGLPLHTMIHCSTAECVCAGADYHRKWPKFCLFQYFYCFVNILTCVDC